MNGVLMSLLPTDVMLGKKSSLEAQILCKQTAITKISTMCSQNCLAQISVWARFGCAFSFLFLLAL